MESCLQEFNFAHNNYVDSKLRLLRFYGDSQEGAILEWKEMFVGISLSISLICHIYYFQLPTHQGWQCASVSSLLIYKLVLFCLSGYRDPMTISPMGRTNPWILEGEVGEPRQATIHFISPFQIKSILN